MEVRKQQQRRRYFCVLEKLFNSNVICQMWSEYKVIRETDPACKSAFEALLCYPGLWALWMHHICHLMYTWSIPLLPRILMTLVRVFLNIDIHPGARFGTGCFIDHGSGVVIGETAIIGDNCVIYQGVTLGGTGKETGKRHPTIGSNCVFGSGSKVLGNITLGDDVKVGAGSVVVKSVESGCTVVGIPARAVRMAAKERARDLNQGSIPDMEARAIRALYERSRDIEHELLAMRKKLAEVTNEPVQPGDHIKHYYGDHPNPATIAASAQEILEGIRHRRSSASTPRNSGQFLSTDVVAPETESKKIPAALPRPSSVSSLQDVENFIDGAGI